MRVIETQIPGCLILEGTRFTDHRGSFEETYRRDAFRELGLPTDWAQENVSVSEYGTLRGLHVQKKNPQGKLVRCLWGMIHDVCVDLRLDSPTYGRWTIARLSSTSSRALYLPPGCAHGFEVLKGPATVHYMCTTLYDKDSDGGVYFADPDLNIPWKTREPITSERDEKLPLLSEYRKLSWTLSDAAGKL